MRASKAKTMGRFEWFLLIILSVLWGGSFFSGKVALAELGPFTLVFGRVAIAAIALNLIVVATGHRMPSSLRTWRQFLIMGALNNLIPFSLIFWGQTQIASGLDLPVIHTVELLNWAYGGEKPSKIKINPPGRRV